MFGIGVSTGGSHTDAVIMRLNDKKIVAKTKSRTTHYDLSVGIIESINKVLATSNIPTDEIALVSLASTLATNAVIEGKGAKVGLILIGFEPDKTWDIPAATTMTVKGGHGPDGVEQAYLEIDEVSSVVENMKNNVDAFAVSGYFSVRNPIHELTVKELIKKKTGKPVTCGYELAAELGIYERTVTAVLNARLIPIVENLLREIRDALDQKGLDVPLMIVKGDGSLMNEEIALERPVEGIQSGPAASVLGGLFLAGKEDAVVVDMGSTTSIITAFKESTPYVVEEGVRIAGWKTRVKAVDADAWGIGGDGWIHIDPEKGIDVGPRRVIPLAFAASVFPNLSQKIEQYKTTDFITISQAPRKAENVGELSKKFLDAVQKLEPTTSLEINNHLTDFPIAELLSSFLLERGYIIGIGLTPTDLMHAKGFYTAGDVDTAVLGADLFARKNELTLDELQKRVWQLIAEKLVSRTFEKMMLKLNKWDSSQKCVTCSEIVRKISDGNADGDFRVQATINIPLVGIGAPVYLFLPEVAKRFGTVAIIPEHHEVGAAVGSLVGSVIGSFELYIAKEIKPDRYVVFPGRHIFGTFEQAIDFAMKIGTEEATKSAKRAGAEDLKIKIDRKDGVFPKVGFLWSEIKISAVGRPTIRKHIRT
ncbi:MAG: hydantoinase/oxoprolinase family protein [Nitrososphaerales archaeon]